MNKVVLNKPMPSTREGKKLMVYVKNPETGRVKTIHFGDSDYRHNYSKEAWKSYMARSAGIRDAKGRLTKDNPQSANYWARKYLWNGSKWRR